MESIRTKPRRGGAWRRLLFLGLLLGLFGLLGLLGIGMGRAMAAPPANDTCAGAVLIPSTTFPYWTPILTNIDEATLDGDPLPSCIGGARRGVWYRFVPSQDGTYTFSTGPDTATTAFDTILAVYAAANCGLVTNEVACNDDSGAGNNRAGLLVELKATTNYFVLVWLSEADDFPPNSLSMQLRVDRPTRPINDTCAMAEMILASNFPRRSSTNETVLAAAVTDTPSCGAGYRSVWYKFTPATTGTYILSTGSETATTVFDTVMVLYSTANDCSGLVEVACSDNGEGRGSMFRTLTGGTTYYIAVHDLSFEPVISETIVQLSVATPTIPSVVTLPVSSIASTGAVVNGVVNPNGLQSRFWFEWGPSTAYNSTSQVRLLFPGTTALPTNAPVAGFAPNTTYHYRMVATNNLGRANGEDMTFRWVSTRPTLINPERLLSGNFRFAFIGNSTQLYVIETSTNLTSTSWSYLGTASEAPAGSGIFVYTHVGAGSATRRFYRVNSP
jgi:hypothetical protein